MLYVVNQSMLDFVLPEPFNRHDFLSYPDVLYLLPSEHGILTAQRISNLCQASQICAKLFMRYSIGCISILHASVALCDALVILLLPAALFSMHRRSKKAQTSFYMLAAVILA